MLIEISNYLSRVEASQYSIFTQKFHSSVSKTLRKFSGEIIRNDNNNYLVSFQSVSDGVLCALDIRYKFKYVTPKNKSFSRRLNIAVDISKNKNKEDIVLATRMCEIVKGQLVISGAVNTLYEIENEQAGIDKELIRILTPGEEKFLNDVMDLMEESWSKSDFNVTVFSEKLGYSYSQLYRRLLNLTEISPNIFIKEFRLHKALVLLHEQRGSISQIASKTGFNSSGYFSDCFVQKYGIRPSKYVRQHI